MSELKIEYYSGAGNLFSIIDNRKYKINPKKFSEIAQICCTKSNPFTIRTEGLIVMDSSEINAFDVKFFNPDGSHGMMCGNGARSAVRFALNNNILILQNENDMIPFELAGIIYFANLENNLIKVKFPKQNLIEIPKLVPFGGKQLHGMFADVGTLHLIFNYEHVPFSENFEYDFYPLIDFAPQIRYDLDSFPNGTNVSIFKIIDKSTIFLRTYEKGVENETGACGTGAVAAALLNYLQNNTNKKVKIIPTSKSELEVEIISSNDKIEGFYLKGDAIKIGEAYFKIEDLC
ncbi:MAG: diaminopimelate epimerase [Ignavibacteria bacterium GWF2_33_9]|nr:MAG: diaminopimelate epimerase [Ignavibacteria bacterium GWF2_33_9]